MIAVLRRWRDRRRREADCLVLQALRDNRPHHVHADLHAATGLRPGRLYPALTRLLERGQVEQGWDPQPSGRRWYRLATASDLTTTEETR